MDTKQTRAARWAQLIQDVIAHQTHRPGVERDVVVTQAQVDQGVECMDERDLYDAFDEDDITTVCDAVTLRGVSSGRSDLSASAALDLAAEFRIRLRDHVMQTIKADVFDELEINHPLLICDDDSFSQASLR